MLEEKLLEIGKALGKVDERGQVTEDLRAQILGQLSERLSYDKLYQDALNDPTLKRTRQELEVALENAKTAREVVFELFQDLDGFRLDDYKQFDDSGKGMERLLRYVQAGVQQAGGTVQPRGPSLYEVTLNGEPPQRISTDRNKAKEDENLSLLGLGASAGAAAHRGASAAWCRGSRSCGPTCGWRRRARCGVDLARRDP